MSKMILWLMVKMRKMILWLSRKLQGIAPPRVTEKEAIEIVQNACRLSSIQWKEPQVTERESEFVIQLGTDTFIGGYAQFIVDIHTGQIRHSSHDLKPECPPNVPDKNDDVGQGER